MKDWVSPRLQIRFDLSGDELQIFRPDGERFLSYGEIARRAEQERQRAEQAEARARLLEQRLREMGVELE
jgi:hypothetical protein